MEVVQDYAFKNLIFTTLESDFMRIFEARKEFLHLAISGLQEEQSKEELLEFANDIFMTDSPHRKVVIVNREVFLKAAQGMLEDRLHTQESILKEIFNKMQAFDDELELFKRLPDYNAASEIKFIKLYAIKLWFFIDAEHKNDEKISAEIKRKRDQRYLHDKSKQQALTTCSGLCALTLYQDLLAHLTQGFDVEMASLVQNYVDTPVKKQESFLAEMTKTLSREIAKANRVLSYAYLRADEKEMADAILNDLRIKSMLDELVGYHADFAYRLTLLHNATILLNELIARKNAIQASVVETKAVDEEPKKMQPTAEQPKREKRSNQTNTSKAKGKVRTRNQARVVTTTTQSQIPSDFPKLVNLTDAEKINFNNTADNILEDLACGHDLHKTFSFTDLLKVIDALHGSNVSGHTNGSHFTFDIPNRGSIHLVYAHGDNDTRKLSGTYVRLFIKQLVLIKVLMDNLTT